MKLYYAPGACSMAPHIALREAGASFELERVDLAAKRTERGADYAAVNPKGYVPALELDGGEVLTEVPVVLQYIADQHPAAGLAPPAGGMERYRLQAWLGFVNSELHKTMGPLFRPTTPEDYKPVARQYLAKRLDYLNGELAGRDYLTGDGFTVADAYAFTVLGWTGRLNIALDPWPSLAPYLARVRERPKVQEAMRAEGLIG